VSAGGGRVKSANVEKVLFRIGETNASTSVTTAVTKSVTGGSTTCTVTCAVAQSEQSACEISPTGWACTTWIVPVATTRNTQSRARRSLHELCIFGLGHGLSTMNLIYPKTLHACDREAVKTVRFARLAASSINRKNTENAQLTRHLLSRINSYYLFSYTS
jgi:hypothetical protein